ncbi:Ferric-chelate reductase 1 [Aphelenchoides bicaudatus]|nr:Ferric-chelate reductase 1 [Aphelenchoides bicaudatus]
MTTTTTQHPAIDAQTKWLLTQVHATAFIVAWFFCVVVSILVARYTRVPRNGILNPQFWFQTHRILNYLALGLMLIGLLTIFIAHQWRWLGPVVGGDRNSSSTAWHTLFGILSIGLAVIQPLNSFIRCDPSHQQRPIFNWIHRSIGAFCVAVCSRLHFDSLPFIH